MAGKKTDKRPADTLKIEGSWEDVAARLLSVPPKSTPVRAVKARKKASKARPKK